MPTPQQQNYRQMIDSVLKKYPDYDVNQVKQDINDALREIMARRSWSGLVHYAILPVPASYLVGTVTTVQGSNVVNGVGTTWLWNDILTTSLQIGNVETGIIDVQPTSMANINPGMWLTVSGGNADQECVYVISIDQAASTFRARFAQIHVAGVSITCGSMAGRQFRTNSNCPFYTVTGLVSPTQLIISFPWAYSSLSNTSYEITLVYVSFGQDVKEMLTMVNPDRQYQFYLNCPKALLDAQDPRRSWSSMPFRLAYHEPDPAGAPLYEIWPRPTSVASYPYIYLRAWTPLEGDNDILPNGIRSDIVTKIARAEAASWAGHKLIQGGVYYDMQLASRLKAEAEKGIQEMKNEDDSTAIMQLVYQYRNWGYGGGPPPNWYNTDSQSYLV